MSSLTELETLPMGAGASPEQIAELEETKEQLDRQAQAFAQERKRFKQEIEQLKVQNKDITKKLAAKDDLQKAMDEKMNELNAKIEGKLIVLLNSPIYTLICLSKFSSFLRVNLFL